MRADPALRDELAVRAWLKGVPPAERAAALDDAAEGHGLRRRAAEAQQKARDRGTWYTPAALVDCALDAAATPATIRSGDVCDPACGSGHFLVRAATRMRSAGCSGADIARRLHGCDIDPRAVAIARVRLQHAVGGAATQWRRQIRCCDALDAATWVDERGTPMTFGAVVGNPPFLNQLHRGTAATRAEAAALKSRFNGVVRGYADTACAFLLLATELCGARGRIALVVPMSVLASADAAGTRREAARVCELRACLVPPTRVFGEGVPTVVLVLGKGWRSHQTIDVRAVLGASPATARGAEATVPARAVAGGAWGAMLAALAGVPCVRAGPPSEVVADIASATADFRQHYYGLKGRIREHAEGAHARAPTMPRPGRGGVAAVATVGSIDAAACHWGVRAVRLHGRAYRAPVADVRGLATSKDMGRWVKDRLVPKVLVATQTRSIEAWVDAHGAVLPSTPLVTVVPKQRANVWLLAAALLAPATSATAWWRHAGAALSPTALKLSAKQVLQLPLPTQRAAWAQGAAHLKSWHSAPGNPEHRAAFARAMNRAYRIQPAAAGDALVAWWLRQTKAAGAPHVLLNSPVCTAGD